MSSDITAAPELGMPAAERSVAPAITAKRSHQLGLTTEPLDNLALLLEEIAEIGRRK